ncbi:hypothetical protein CMEL01_09834 [Colletotrichum melonis]|uniref:Uncharacterized protein n=1 Tax=Colletotrichum melonis TaxID=1209925 RepID=A0AAI9TVM7_9PEZI|nr:hypothetical protein CMEL01_09834 [Colletotrichum melonis]
MPEFGMPGFEVSEFNMSDFHISNFNCDMPADGIAPDAFKWLDENPAPDVVSAVALVPPVAENSPFQADLDMLDDATVPYERKKWILDVILNDIVPYRFHDHLRLFPTLEFYSTLLYNRLDRSAIWGLVARFHEWISSVAASSAEDADEAIEALKLRASFCGWPGELNDDFKGSSSTQFFNEGSASKQQQMATSSPFSPQTVHAVPDVGESQPSPMMQQKHPLLEAELVIAPVFQYRGIIRNIEHSKELDNAYERHVTRVAGEAPDNDASWPFSSEQQRAYVQRLFESITDLDDFFELKKARERLGRVANLQQDVPIAQALENPRKRRRGGDAQGGALDPASRPKGMSKTDWALLNDQGTPVDMLEAVIHHRISGVEVEMLCRRLLRCAMEQQQGFTMRPMWSGSRTVSTWEHFNTFSDRWQAICENLQDCKMIVHSLTRADWFCKYAGAPSKERGAKLSNDLLNGRRDIQNQVGRDIIREKTSTQDWTTSDDFEIRNKAGELVLKGGHLGDKKRRQLAVRNKE